MEQNNRERSARPKFMFLKEPQNLRKKQSNYIYDNFKNIQNKFNRLGTNYLYTRKETKNQNIVGLKAT